jgi:hypothetical protein
LSTFVIGIKLHKENDHPLGENSPNLVTLLLSFLPRFEFIFGPRKGGKTNAGKIWQALGCTLEI